MGQSRILEMGKTAIETGSLGGTLGWMSPEEIDSAGWWEHSVASLLKL